MQKLRPPVRRAAAGRDVELEEEAVVAALDLPLDTVLGQVLDLHRPGVTVVLTLDPAGCIVVIRIG